MSGKTLVSVALATLCCLCSVAGVASAQGERQQQVDTEKNEGQESRKAAKRARKKAQQGMAHRVSEIRGMTVKNGADKELGTVSDVVIDVRQGRVRYAALSYGGFLGLGDKLFAVPWEAFEYRHDASEDESTLVLDIDEKTLKDAPGFDESRWPNFADGAIAAELDHHYQGKYRHQRRGRTGVSVTKPGSVDVDVDVKVRRNGTRSPKRKEPRRPANAKDVVHRASEVTGMVVNSRAGKQLGSVSDLVVDMDTGQIRYAALSYGGFAGLGDKLFAVPWKSFNCQFNPSEEEYQLVLPIDETTLRKAPGFDQDNWPNLADQKFADRIDSYYKATRKSKQRENREPRS